MNIERYIKESGDTTKQQIDTFDRWIKESEYYTKVLNQRISGLKLEMKIVIKEIQEIKRYRKIVNKRE